MIKESFLLFDWVYVESPIPGVSTGNSIFLLNTYIRLLFFVTFYGPRIVSEL